MSLNKGVLRDVMVGKTVQHIFRTCRGYKSWNPAGLSALHVQYQATSTIHCSLQSHRRIPNTSSRITPHNRHVSSVAQHQGHTLPRSASMAVKIRPLQQEDEQKWRHYWQMYNEFYKRTIAEDITAKTLERFLDDKVQMYCALAVDESSNDIIGFVTWFPHISTSHIAPVVYLNDLFVDPSVRTSGTGGKLIDHVYEHSKSVLGADMVYWLTQHFNHAAQLLYVKKATKSDFVHYSKTL